MTLTNHLLTGAALAKVLPLPVAIPLAFVSHFVLDALPHFGFKTIKERMSHPRLLGGILLLDCSTATLFIIWLIKGNRWAWLMTGVVAYLPDLLWVYRFIFEERFGKLEPTKGNRFIRFHVNIQKYERVWGLAVEIAYGTAVFALVR